MLSITLVVLLTGQTAELLIGQNIIDTCARKQLSKAATDV